MRSLPRLHGRALALGSTIALLLTTPVGAQTTTSTSSATTSTTTASTSSTTTTTSASEPESTTTTATASAAWAEAVDITFPAPQGVRFSDDYHAPRSGGRVHKAIDLLGDKSMKLFAARAGTICHLTGFDAPPPSYGVAITVCGDDGRKYQYIHVNNDTPGTDDGMGGPEFAFAPGVKRGANVGRGQWIAMMGDSGNAENTAPHLHFEIEDPSIIDPYGTHQRNPYAALKAALERDDVALEPQWAPDPVVRVGGADRVATAIALSARWSAAPAVVLAAGDRVADSLSAGPLAAALGGPVLLNLGEHLDGRVVAEINRLKAGRVVLVGGIAAINAQIEASLRSALPGTTIERIAGQDRYSTGAAVATRVWGAGGSTKRAVVALGDHADPARAWPDALTAGWLGALTGRPVLLTAPSTLPDATRTALQGVASASVVGGEAPVPATVFSQIDSLVGGVTRLAGPDRYATALEVAEAGIAAGASAAHLRVVTGRSPGDALAAGAAAADEKALMILIDGLEQRSDLAVSYWLRPRAETVHSAVTIGGPVVMSDRAMARLARRIT